MFKKIFSKLKSLFSKKDAFGVSFDGSIKLKKLPVKYPDKDNIFYKLNTDLGIFEVTNISIELDLIMITEVGTANEFVLNHKLFTALFTNVPIPKEVQF